MKVVSARNYFRHGCRATPAVVSRHKGSHKYHPMALVAVVDDACRLRDLPGETAIGVSKSGEEKGGIDVRDAFETLGQSELRENGGFGSKFWQRTDFLEDDLGPQKIQRTALRASCIF
ncbi:uncharacterized protein LOC122402014 [Colletes gigas]|uniref:uncharacterized protein LOC122402014 n=1 Tax=Colletes gigas TaxID=935657 RepID=UPI001C9A5AB5|nr:uncharacterized protein LOC122402014 [Colletes gigas]